MISEGESWPAAGSYPQLGNRAFEAELCARTAGQDAAFILPHLRPGMRLLDLGCGPGSITVGLAEAVAPGEVIGIDSQPMMIEHATALAAARGIRTARFEVADAYDLPLDNGSVDAIFANGVLMHLAEPRLVLAEIRRVLRPGGLAGLRDPDWGTSVYFPTTSLLEQWLALRVRVRQHCGGDPFASRSYRTLLRESGFVRVEATASVSSAGSLGATRGHATFLKAQLQGLAPVAIGEGWITQPIIDQVVDDVDAWAERPDAFTATTWIQVLGWIDNPIGRS